MKKYLYLLTGLLILFSVNCRAAEPFAGFHPTKLADTAGSGQAAETKTTAADTKTTTAAVMELDAKEGVSAGMVSTVSDYLRTQLVNTNKFNIVTRENMESILKEQKFQMSGCTSQECIVELGQLLGVRKMFTGSIGKVGNVYILNVKIVNVESGKIEKAEAEEASTEENLLPAVRNLAQKIAGLAAAQPSAEEQRIEKKKKQLLEKTKSRGR